MLSNTLMSSSAHRGLHRLGEPFVHYDLYTGDAYFYLTQEQHNVHSLLYSTKLSYSPNELHDHKGDLIKTTLLSEVPNIVVNSFIANEVTYMVDVQTVQSKYHISNQTMALAAGLSHYILSQDSVALQTNFNPHMRVVNLLKRKPMLSSDIEMLVYLSRFDSLTIEESLELSELPFSYIHVLLDNPNGYEYITVPDAYIDDVNKEIVTVVAPPVWGRVKKYLTDS